MKCRVVRWERVLPGMTRGASVIMELRPQPGSLSDSLVATRHCTPYARGSAGTGACCRVHCESQFFVGRCTETHVEDATRPTGSPNVLGVRV